MITIYFIKINISYYLDLSQYAITKLRLLWSHNIIFLCRKRDQQKCYDQVKITRKRDRETGLNSLKYDVLNIHHMTVDDIPFVVIIVKLKCDKPLTPWCDCEGAAASERGKWPQV